MPLRTLIFYKYIKQLHVNLRHLVYTRHYSLLYVTGDKASKIYSLLTPHIDLEERVTNRTELLNNIKARDLPIALDKVESRWKFYKHLSEQKQSLEYTRSLLSKEITKLLADPEKNSSELEKLKLHAQMAKNDLANLKDFLYGVEEAAALHALSLPNRLHKKTPLYDEFIVSSLSRQYLQNQSTKCHSLIYPQYFHFVEPAVVYLLEEAALFEHAVCNFLQQKLNLLNFNSMSNPNISTGVISEGCTFSNYETIKVKTENIGTENHLKGGASLNAFMAYFARFQLKPTQFPLKLFAIGRKYDEVRNTEPPTLFKLTQYVAIEAFIVTKENEYEQCNCLVKTMTEIYNELDLKFRCVLLPANKLQAYESIRYSFQMYSNSCKSFVEVGNVSMCDDFLSKRLLVTYDENKCRKYAQIITGCILNVHKALGCLIENNEVLKVDILSDNLRKFLY